MASLEIDSKSGFFKVRFRLQGIACKRSLKTNDPKEAKAVVARIEETIRLVERGRLDMPTDADPVAFVMSDGKQTSTDIAPKIRTMGSLASTQTITRGCTNGGRHDQEVDGQRFRIHQR